MATSFSTLPDGTVAPPSGFASWGDFDRAMLLRSTSPLYYAEVPTACKCGMTGKMAVFNDRLYTPRSMRCFGCYRMMRHPKPR
jgi:hypothetical protein